MQQQLRNSLNQISSSNGGAFQSLADIGIGRDSNDLLTLNTSTLNSALTTNYTDVKALIQGSGTGNTGIFNGVYSSYNNMSDSVTGEVVTSINGYQTSITNINNSVAEQTQRINQLNDTLTQQYAAVQSAISQMNSQGTTLTAIIKSLTPNSSNNGN